MNFDLARGQVPEKPELAAARGIDASLTSRFASAARRQGLDLPVVHVLASSTTIK
jgi:hypothetical protein